MNRLRIGIVGLGYRMGHLGALFCKYAPYAELVAYSDLVEFPPGLARLKEERCAPKRGYRSLDEMLAKESLDLLAIGTPNFQHLEDIGKGLAAGLKIFSEKPVVSCEQQTWSLAKLLQEYDYRRILMGLVLRYSQHLKDLNQLLIDEVVGEITAIEGSEHIPPYHGAFFMRDWRRKQDYSGGFLLEKCCHDLDLYNMITRSRPIQVASFGGRKSFVPRNEPASSVDKSVYYRKPSGWQAKEKVFDSDADIIDYQTGLLLYETGATMVFHTNLNVPNHGRRFFIVGTKGTIEGDFVRGYIKAFDAHSGKKKFDRQYDDETAVGLSNNHYQADDLMVQDLLKVIAGETSPLASVWDAMSAGLVAMKLDQARKKNEIVDLSETWKKFDSYRN